jgi:hypothetical protein
VQKLLDLEVFTDPRRMHFAQSLGGKAVAKVEKAGVAKAQLNVLAKMQLQGVEHARVAAAAKAMGVDMGDVAAQVAKIQALQKPGARRLAELKIDDLYRRFDAEKDLARKSALAEEMSELQGMVNASTGGAYVTPGGVAMNVSIRDNVGAARDWGHATKIMRYEATLDDMAMLEITAHKIAEKGIDKDTAKAMVKYADRMLVRAGQAGGLDMGAKAAPGLFRARELFDQVDGLLAAARKDPAGAAQRAKPLFADAAKALAEGMEEIIRSTKAAAERGSGAAAAAAADEAASLTKELEPLRKLYDSARVAVVDTSER